MTLNSNTTTNTISLQNELIFKYKQLEKSVRINFLQKKVSYTSPVNFKESMESERHRWFPYKEGFSPSFVSQFLIESMVENTSGIVLDPFSGVGTTALVAGQMGIKAIGMDVSPLSTFVAQTKIITMLEEEQKSFEDFMQEFSHCKLEHAYPPPDNETVMSYYEPEYLDALLKVRFYIEQISSEKIKDLFFLAYLSILEEYSTHRKAGNGVKRKTKIAYEESNVSPVEAVRQKLLLLLNIYLIDIRSSKIDCSPVFVNQSCLDEISYANIENISGVVTSPPYANCFDYSKIYMRELWLGDFFKSKTDQKVFRQNSLRSHVHATWESRHSNYYEPLIEELVIPILKQEKMWSSKIPDMLSGYFKDISRVIDLIGRNCKPGTRVGFVVSNSFYGGIPVATDLLISQCASRVGFDTVSIDVYRGMIPSSQQYKRIEDKYFMRESLVVLEKI